MMERAGYLPGLDGANVEYQVLNYTRGDLRVEVEVPALSDEQLVRVINTVRDARERILAPMRTDEIIAVIDAVIGRLLDRDDPFRRKAEELLPAVTGYDAEMVRLGLTDYLKTFRAPDLKRFVSEDFANPGLLDGFEAAPKGGFVRALGPPVLAHVWAGNVPALPLWSLACGLLVKAGNVGKVASAEPLFATWFAQLLAEVEPRLADCLAIVWWAGGDERAEQTVFGQSNVVLAYGGNDALEAIRARVPITTRYLPYGHKLSFAYVGAEALDAQKAWQTAHRGAIDIMRYDQQGCYSPQLFFVERGGGVSAPEYSRYLANELESFEKKHPRRALTLEEAGDVAAWRHREETELLAHPDHELLGSDSGQWTVVHTERADQLRPSGLNRTVRVVAVDEPAQALALLQPYRALLQTAGVALTPERLLPVSDALGRAGVTRICALGNMASPEAGWHHDGRFNLLDLVTMVEVEQSSVVSADALAPYAD
ncbi:MAG: acyl-CoA reductase [Pseudomonadota bacterium]